MKRFGLIGVAGCIAPLYLRTIKEIAQVVQKVMES